MSRPISYTSAVTFNPASYISSTCASITNQTIPIGQGSGATSYSQVNLTTGSNAVTEAFWGFDCSSIPEGATINSVSCSCKCSINTTTASRVATRQAQLYAGTTAKGSSANVATSTTAFNITAGSWNRNELQNARIRLYAVRGTSNTGTSYYFRFYGVSLLVNYTVDGTAYEIIAESTYTGATVSPATQEVMGGGSATVAIYPDDINNIIVEDNGTDVTNQLQYVSPTPETQTFNGIPTSYDSTNSTYDSIYTGSTNDGLADSGSTSRVSVYANTGANAESYMYYNFDCSSIPQDATITDMVCVAKASTFCASTCFSTYQLELCTGTTPKGTPKQIQGNGSTASANTIQGGSNWTRAELNNLKLRFKIVRGTSNTSSQASFSFWGASLQITYTLPSDPYYTYTLTNISADHDIVVSESIIIPPEEDPTKTYYSVTISSINATTDPGRGTTRVESGTGQTITITPSDPQLTLALDNGVDVSSQLVAHGGTIQDPTIITAPSASYGFTLNSSTGYYVSQNAGQASSAAVARVTFDLPVRCLITIQYINYAEATYDYGIFSNIDTALGTTYTADSGAYKSCSTNADNTSTPQTLTYEMESGSHFIDIKFRKDTNTDSNNDNLQFKILNIEPLDPIVGYYTYDLSNISANHSLVFIFGDVTYYFVTSSTDSDAKLYPDGQMVQLPGDAYKLVAVPENTGDTITVRDNNVDVTSSLVKKEETIQKEGSAITVVNYIYTLSNVQTGHTIVVYSTPSTVPYMKVNDSWVQLRAIYKKENGGWIEQEPSTDIFDDDTIYVKGD